MRKPGQSYRAPCDRCRAVVTHNKSTNKPVQGHLRSLRCFSLRHRPKCAGKLSSGHPCGEYALERMDGTFAEKCKNHGGAAISRSREEIARRTATRRANVARRRVAA